MAVLGLLPIGLNTNRDSLEQTAAAAVAREVAADFWGLSSTAIAAHTVTQTPRFQLPLPATTAASLTAPAATRFLADDGTWTLVFGTTSHYRVDVAYGATTSATQPAPLRIIVTWPASANSQAGKWPTNMSGAFQTVTVLNTF